MPKLKEAAVAVAGTILDVEETPEYVDNKRTDRISAYKVLVSVGNGDGFASIKLLPPEFVELRPEIGAGVSWMARPGAWARDGGGEAQATMRFVRPVGPNDLDRIVSFSAFADKSGK